MEYHGIPISKLIAEIWCITSTLSTHIRNNFDRRNSAESAEYVVDSYVPKISVTRTSTDIIVIISSFFLPTFVDQKHFTSHVQFLDTFI